jgi:hypothetical protein
MQGTNDASDKEGEEEEAESSSEEEEEVDALLDENELQELKKGRQIAREDAKKGKVEKASNFEILKVRDKEAAAAGGGKKGGAKTQ